MKNKAYENVVCNLCGENNYSVVYPARPEFEKDFDLIKKFRASGDELLTDQLVECNKCGLKFVNPRIKSGLIIDGYSGGDDPVFVSQAKSREKTFFNSLRYIEKFTKKGKILDVGTAGGSFLAAAKKRGWDVYGCEPNKWLANWGNKNYGLSIKAGTIFDMKYKPEFFNVVTLWDVIEHTPDPYAVLAKCNSLLADNGILVVNYPDIDSLISRLMGQKWLFLTSVHLYYFTPKTIESMLRKSGFEIIKMKPHMQKLELGYLMFRAGNYSKIISKMGAGVVGLLGMENREVPYWLGQTFIIARKRRNIKA